MAGLIQFFHNASIVKMAFLAVVVGIGGGIGAVVFHFLIGGFTVLFFGTASSENFLGQVVSLPWYWRVFIPALGGLLVGLILAHKKVGEAHGDGVPEVMEAVALKRGKVSPLVAPIKALVSAISIGSGGAGGREGPIIQIGSAIGSSLGQLLKLDSRKTKLLLAAGAAAGIGGTFNAPLAGIIFAWEILLRKMSMASFIVLAIASGVGTVFANYIVGFSGPLFNLPAVELTSYWEILLFAGLGVTAAGIALVFTNSLYAIEGIFEKLRVSNIVKPALGGLLVGILALALPQVHEPAAYPFMTDVFNASIPLLFVAVLIFAKIVATSLTLGSGGSGGIFAPSLFVGAMLGTVYAGIIAFVFPGSMSTASAYATVGMGAVFAGATHAPITAIIILLEITQSPSMALPLVVACLISAYVARKLQRKSIYTGELVKDGIDIEARHLP